MSARNTPHCHRARWPGARLIFSPHRSNKTHKGEAADPQQSAEQVILGMALSYLASSSLHVANELGIADLLKDGPQSIEQLVLRPINNFLIELKSGAQFFRQKQRISRA